jgi:hypothetical protein
MNELEMVEINYSLNRQLNVDETWITVDHIVPPTLVFFGTMKLRADG